MEIVSARRKDDIIIVIIQDNDNKGIFIENINDVAAAILDYNKNDLVGYNLFKILDDQLQKKILSHIEFERYGITIDSILAKTKNIHLIRKDGEKIKVKVKVFLTVSNNENKIRFEILARTLDYIDELALFRESLGYYEYSIDNALKVMDADAVKREISMLSLFSVQHNSDCIVAFIKLNKFSDAFAHEVIKALKSKIRIYDEIGILENHLVLFLIGCEKGNVDNIFKRLPHEINKNITIYFYNLKEHPINQPGDKVIVDMQKFAGKLHY